MTDEYPKLDPEIKQKWLAWLRDPNNKQGAYRLRSTDDEFCCLGGLCQIIDPAGWRAPVQGPFQSSKSLFHQGDTTAPSREVRAVAWPNEKDASRGVSDAIVMLMKMNDEEENTFPEIAAWIEEYL